MSRTERIQRQAISKLGWTKQDARNLGWIIKKVSAEKAEEMLCQIESLLGTDEDQERVSEMYEVALGVRQYEVAPVRPLTMIEKGMMLAGCVATVVVHCLLVF